MRSEAAAPPPHLPSQTASRRAAKAPARRMPAPGGTQPRLAEPAAGWEGSAARWPELPPACATSCIMPHALVLLDLFVFVMATSC